MTCSIRTLTAHSAAHTLVADDASRVQGCPDSRFSDSHQPWLNGIYVVVGTSSVST